ncbi:MAG TPA: response regulator [Acidiferrobacteraceae bacterium]|nr:response regulator [Acidiferrobacteraceae bacterium]
METIFKDKKVLVIDDFPEMRSSLRRMLDSFGVESCDDVDSGERAIEKMEEKAYDIVLCDYNLGLDRKDGQQVLEEAKHRELLPYHVIFMMITAENTMAMVMGAVEYKPDDYLTKPFTKEVLHTRLKRLLERKTHMVGLEQAIHNKEYRKAIAICDSHLASKPKNIMELLKVKGGLCIKAGDFELAVKTYEQVLGVRDLPWARMGLGKSAYYENRFEDAKKTFEGLIEQNKTNIEAYDWLAKVLVKLDQPEVAQEVLAKAVKLSPNAIRRMNQLGELAHENNDLDTAKKSYKKAIQLGKHSCLKGPEHFTGLAKVLVEQDNTDEALEVAQATRKEFKGNTDADLQASVMEGVIYTQRHEEDKAKEAIGKANKIYEENKGEVSASVTMDMAKVNFAVGDEEHGKDLVQDLVRDHHEDDKLLKEVEAVLENSSLKDEGKEIIEQTKKEIIDINNKGVYLVKEGKMEEAISFLEQAADGLPNNKTINLNAVQAMLLYMERNGKDDSYIKKSRQFLDRVAKTDPASEKYQRLAAVYQGIIAA